MNIIWGLIIALYGIWLALSAQRESENPVYRLFVARSLWRGNVHRFHLYAGAACLAVGIFTATR